MLTYHSVSCVSSFLYLSYLTSETQQRHPETRYSRSSKSPPSFSPPFQQAASLSLDLGLDWLGLRAILREQCFGQDLVSSQITRSSTGI